MKSETGLEQKSKPSSESLALISRLTPLRRYEVEDAVALMGSDPMNGDDDARLVQRTCKGPEFATVRHLCGLFLAADDEDERRNWAGQIARELDSVMKEDADA